MKAKLWCWNTRGRDEETSIRHVKLLLRAGELSRWMLMYTGDTEAAVSQTHRVALSRTYDDKAISHAQAGPTVGRPCACRVALDSRDAQT
jgi:hypothetical protein